MNEVVEDGLMDEMFQLVNKYCTEPDLNACLKSFIHDKMNESARWADITKYTHYMLGGESPLIERSAALSELMILAIDIVDDIQDQDNPSKPWMQCPPHQALNAVCSLMAAFIAEVPAQASAMAGQLLAISVNGQHLDLSASVETESDYMNMIHKKSGSLLRFASHMGTCLLPEQPAEVLAAIDELAECVGVVAQLENDLNDVRQLEAKNDLICKKKTLPILFLLRGGEEEFPWINRYYSGEITADQFFSKKEELLAYVESSGCVEYTKVIQGLYIDRAEELLQKLPATDDWRTRFRSITIDTRAKIT